ncbi:hypothetical protein RFI_10867 [Reticulomyxa filosa]|uniref:Uncharacterized protein n=1 Tax=Reticulomyxa filosa TaxID=46433 RepID=X6NIW3_RETFI|nr:hypothetical protein RFI_10867 [Reticulomyxa filosa]|eukprot:ETO26270.1 hypothetical protein RFI_10867 [Reticulomyxa filosa]
MCGKCKEGYSETVGAGMGCDQCVGTNWWIVIIPVIPCFALVVWILRSTPLQKQQKKQQSPKPVHDAKSRVEDNAKVTGEAVAEGDSFGGSDSINLWFWNPFLFKIIGYFCQSVTVFLNRNLIAIYGAIFSLFGPSLNYSYNGTRDIGYCVFEGMTALQQAFSPLYIVALLFFIFALFMCAPRSWYVYLLCFSWCSSNRFCNKDRASVTMMMQSKASLAAANARSEEEEEEDMLRRPWLQDSTVASISSPVSNDDNDNETEPITMETTIDWKAAFVVLFLFTFNTMIWSLFSVLSCRFISGYGWRHSFAGDQHCFDAGWWIAFVFTTLLMIAMVGLFVYLAKWKEPWERRSSPICYYYKDETWYWEFVIIVRRVTIILLTRVSPWKRFTNLCLTLVVCQFSLMAQLMKKPFKHHQLNVWESILLTVLTMVLIICVAYNQDAITQHKATILMSIIMITPFIAIAFEAFRQRLCCQVRRHFDWSFDASTLNKYSRKSRSHFAVVVWDAPQPASSDTTK